MALYPNCKVTGLEVDAVQHAKNLFHLQRGIEFVEAGAQNVPFPDDAFDLALMLKSLHHVPIDLMDQALEEVARVLRTGSLFYVPEPIKREHSTISYVCTTMRVSSEVRRKWL